MLTDLQMQQRLQSRQSPQRNSLDVALPTMPAAISFTHQVAETPLLNYEDAECPISTNSTFYSPSSAVLHIRPHKASLTPWITLQDHFSETWVISYRYVTRADGRPHELSSSPSPSPTMIGPLEGGSLPYHAPPLPPAADMYPPRCTGE